MSIRSFATSTMSPLNIAARVPVSMVIFSQAITLGDSYLGSLNPVSPLCTSIHHLYFYFSIIFTFAFTNTFFMCSFAPLSRHNKLWRTPSPTSTPSSVKYISAFVCMSIESQWVWLVDLAFFMVFILHV